MQQSRQNSNYHGKQQQQQQQNKLKRRRPSRDSDHDQDDQDQDDAKTAPSPQPSPPKKRKSTPSTPAIPWPDSALLASINHLACHLFEPTALRSLDGSALYALGMLIKAHADSFFEAPTNTDRTFDSAPTDQTVEQEVAALTADLHARRPIDLTDKRVMEHLTKVQQKAAAEEQKNKASTQERVAKALATRLANRTAEFAKYGLNPDGSRIDGTPLKTIAKRAAVDNQPFQQLCANPLWCALCRRLETTDKDHVSWPKPRLVYSAMVDAYVPLPVCPVCTRGLRSRPVHCPYCYRVSPMPAARAACQYAQANPTAQVRSKVKAGPPPEPLKCPTCSHRLRVLDDDDPLFIRDLQAVELPARAVRLDAVPPDDEAAPVDWPSLVAAERESTAQ